MGASASRRVRRNLQPELKKAAEETLALLRKRPMELWAHLTDHSYPPDRRRPDARSLVWGRLLEHYMADVAAARDPWPEWDAAVDMLLVAVGLLGQDGQLVPAVLDLLQPTREAIIKMARLAATAQNAPQRPARQQDQRVQEELAALELLPKVGGSIHEVFGLIGPPPNLVGSRSLDPSGRR